VNAPITVNAAMTKVLAEATKSNTESCIVIVIEFPLLFGPAPLASP
jgi:hypothetical protein